jgi:hypothetical protein
MANVYEGKANFLHGLSDMWTRFFRDRPRLEAMYKGTEILAGQAYLDLVGNILCLSVRETPVFRKEFFKLITVREDLVTLRDDGNWQFEVTDAGIKDFQFLYNKIFDPTVVLESSIDFEVENEDADVIVFYTNPCDWDGAGATIPGVASRAVVVADSDGNETEERELAFWAPDAQIDNNDLYLNFGHMVGRFEPSSEAYRSLIQGIMQYFVLGPTASHLVSALNVIIGLSVIRDDGEILQSVDYSGEDVNVVVTDQANYSFPKEVALRDEVTDTSNWGVYVFSAFEHLTKVFLIYDTIIDPTWWFDREIPDQLLPDENRLRRQVTPELHENVVDYPVGLVKVGDPGVFVGADDDGYVPAVDGDHPLPYTGPGYEDNTALWRPTYRHGFGYITYERFLKHHTFVVDFDHDVLQSGILPFNLLSDDLGNIIDAGRSAYTFMITEPGLLFVDRLKIDTDSQDKLDLYIDRDVEDDQMTIYDTTLVVGETSVVVGDYYNYNGSPSWDITVNNAPWPGPLPDASGNTPVVVGGADPSATVETDAVQTFSGYCDNVQGNPVVGRVRESTYATIFDETDVGRWIEYSGNFFQIVRQYGWGAWIFPNPGVTGLQTWSTYDHGPAALGDLAVEITVT